jgi:hypothetical protein
VEVAVARKKEFYGQLKVIKKISPKTPAQSIKDAQSTQGAGG